MRTMLAGMKQATDLVDWARISELRSEIGAEDFSDVVDLFLEEVETEIAALESNLATDTLEARLHFLKGSALNLGFEAFSALCQSGESAAARGLGNEVDVPAILDSYHRSKSVFLKGLTSE